MARTPMPPARPTRRELMSYVGAMTGDLARMTRGVRGCGDLRRLLLMASQEASNVYARID